MDNEDIKKGALGLSIYYEREVVLIGDNIKILLRRHPTHSGQVRVIIKAPRSEKISRKRINKGDNI